MALTSRKLTGLLADENRRRVIAAMILGATTPDEIVSKAALGERDVIVALERLTQAGLVDVAGGSYLLLEQAFQAAARSEAPPSPASQFPDRPPKARKVLDQAFRDGRLIRLPAKHTQRLVVLDELAQRFEPGEKYTERQVNALLSASDIDVATLRRNLVDHGLLERADGSYWRSGGRFDID